MPWLPFVERTRSVQVRQVQNDELNTRWRHRLYSNETHAIYKNERINILTINLPYQYKPYTSGFYTTQFVAIASFLRLPIGRFVMATTAPTFPQLASKVNTKAATFQTTASKWDAILGDFDIASAEASRESKSAGAIEKHTARQLLGELGPTTPYPPVSR